MHDQVNMEKLTLDMVGSSGAVRNARILLPTQLEYVEKQIVLEGTERQARQKLQEVRKQYGLRSNRGGYDGGEEAPQYNNNRNNNNNNRPGNDRSNPRGGLNNDRLAYQNGLNNDRPIRSNNRSAADSASGPAGHNTKVDRTNGDPEIIPSALVALTKNDNAAATVHDGKPTASKPNKPSPKQTSTEYKPTPIDIKPTSAENKQSSTENKPISTENKPISTENKPSMKPKTVIAGLLANMKASSSTTSTSPTEAATEVVKDMRSDGVSGPAVGEGVTQTARDKSVAARNNARKEKNKPTTTTNVESLANSLKSVLNVVTNNQKDKEPHQTATAGTDTSARDIRDLKPTKTPVLKTPTEQKIVKDTDNSRSDAVKKEVQGPNNVSNNKKVLTVPSTLAVAASVATSVVSTELKDGELNYEEPSLPRRSRQRKLYSAGANNAHDALMEGALPSSLVVGSKPTTPSIGPTVGISSPIDQVVSSPVISYEYNQEGQLVHANANINFKEKMTSNNAVMSLADREVKPPLKSKAVGSNRKEVGSSIIGLTLKEAQQQIVQKE